MDITKNITPEELAAHIEKEGIKVPGSDKVMTPEEFREYTERVRQQALEAWEKLSPEERAAAEENSKKLMEEEAKKFHEEMAKVAEFRKNREAENAQRAPRPNFCTECGAPAGSGNFCTNCGHKL